jgi:hypothetical protein
MKLPIKLQYQALFTTMRLKKNAKIEIFVPEQNGCTRELLKDDGEEEDQRRPLSN